MAMAHKVNIRRFFDGDKVYFRVYRPLSFIAKLGRMRGEFDPRRPI